MNENVLKRVAFSLIKGMNASVARHIIDAVGNIHEFFAWETKDVLRVLDGNDAFCKMLADRKRALATAADELKFIEKHNIKVVSIVDEDLYPKRLAQCHDAPVNLYILGNADFDAKRMLSIVGTRRATPYGVRHCSEFVQDLSEIVGEVTIVSGLAYGIDCVAHEAALRIGMPTIAVLAHGLGMIYPASHRDLASNIIKSGGALVSEYLHDVKPFKGRFLERNRIVAGLSDATFIAESPIKGGAMNTATHARGYDREVLALPGRIGDTMSEGCNKLISRQIALLAGSAKEIAEAACWELKTTDNAKSESQPSIFDNYSGDVKVVFDFLKTQSDPVSIDNIVCHTRIAVRNVMSAIGELDFDGILLRHPGAKFSLI